MKYRPVLAVLIFSGLSAMGQAQPMMPTPAERAERLKERLALSDEQAKKAEAIFQKSQERTREGMMKRMGDREAMREFMQKQMEATDKEIERILTAEQKKKYEELKKERRQGRRGRGEGSSRGTSPTPDR